MQLKHLSDVPRTAVDKALAELRNENPVISLNAGAMLVRNAKETGLCLKDYLTLSILPTAEKDPGKYKDLNGFQAALAYLNLPFANQLEQGVFLQAASDTFQKFPGTRAMFPEVIDQMLRWKNRQTQLDSLAPMLAQSRTISGSEMISTAVDDDSGARGTFVIAEGAKIPIRTIRTSQTSVGIFKHGSGIKTTYEFERRVSLDVLTPFAARVARELELSKVNAAIGIMINGDGVNAAAPVTTITSLGGVVQGTTPLRSQYAAFAKWLITRAALGVPVDTVIGNVNMYLELLLMFTPTLAGQTSQIQAAVAAGGPGINLSIPLLGGSANFALASGMPANRLLGITKSETLEELVEAGSNISENERSIQNQVITYVRTENSGFKLAFADTRSILNLDA